MLKRTFIILTIVSFSLFLVYTPPVKAGDRRVALNKVFQRVKEIKPKTHSITSGNVDKTNCHDVDPPIPQPFVELRVYDDNISMTLDGLGTVTSTDKASFGIRSNAHCLVQATPQPYIYTRDAGFMGWLKMVHQRNFWVIKYLCLIRQVHP